MVMYTNGNKEPRQDTIEVVEVEEVIVSVPDAETPSFEEKKDFKKNFLTVKTASIIAGVLIVGALGLYVRSFFVAATVNGSSISRLEIIDKLEKVSGKDALESFIIEKLITDELNAKKITIDDDAVTKEIQALEDGLKAQNMTLDEALSNQQMTRDDLTKQLTIKKKLEKLLEDKIGVTDQEIAGYITSNEITIPKGEEAQYNDQIKTQLEQQKFSVAVQDLIDSLKASAKIEYHGNYR